MVPLLALLGLAPRADRSVQVLPHAVFLDGRARTAQVQLANTGPTLEDVDIELKFGYPDTDSLGNIFMHLWDAPAPEQPSAARWIRVFPRHVVLLPGRRQTVRLLAEPATDLGVGEYWARMLVTARGVPGGCDAPQVVTTIISVTYRNGAVRTGVALEQFRAGVEGDSLVIRVALTREGNAAYLGTGSVQLVDAADRIRGRWEAPMAVYYRLDRRMAFPLAPVPPGPYTVRFALATDRTDIPQHLALPAPPVEASAQIEVPAR
jgi:hypothetical protein